MYIGAVSTVLVVALFAVQDVDVLVVVGTRIISTAKHDLSIVVLVARLCSSLTPSAHGEQYRRLAVAVPAHRDVTKHHAAHTSDGAHTGHEHIPDAFYLRVRMLLGRQGLLSPGSSY